MSASETTIYGAGFSAQKYAVDLMAFGGREWPKSLIGGTNGISERLHDVGLSFSIHVRRYLELTGFRPQMKELGIAGNVGTTPVEERLYEATHSLIHSRKLNISWHPMADSNFVGGESYQAIFFTCETDKYPLKHIPILGAAWCFLVQKKSRITDERFP